MRKSWLQNDSFWRAALDILLGIVMLIAPNWVYGILVYLIAIYTIFHGLLHMGAYFKLKSQQKLDIWVGALLIILGLSIFTSVDFLASILTYFIGFLLMLYGFIQFATNFLMNRKVDLMGLGISVLIIVCGMLVILAPMRSVKLFIRFCGSVMLVMGIGELTTLRQK